MSENSYVRNDLFEIDEIKNDTVLHINMVGNDDVHRFEGKDIVYISGECIRYQKIIVNNLDNVTMQKIYSIPYAQISSMVIVNVIEEKEQ